MDTVQEIEYILNYVHRETMIALERSRPGDRITIFLSAPLFSHTEIAHKREMQYRLDPHSELPSITLFGCNVEVYADNGLSFYVTMAKKIRCN